MQILLVVVGSALIVVVVVDVVWTTLAVSAGRGPVTGALGRGLWDLALRLGSGHRTLQLAGHLIVAGLLAMWFLLLWLGLFALLSSDLLAVSPLARPPFASQGSGENLSLCCAMPSALRKAPSNSRRDAAVEPDVVVLDEVVTLLRLGWSNRFSPAVLGPLRFALDTFLSTVPLRQVPDERPPVPDLDKLERMMPETMDVSALQRNLGQEDRRSLLLPC